jgi:hypothetical protein
MNHHIYTRGDNGPWSCSDFGAGMGWAFTDLSLLGGVLGPGCLVANGTKKEKERKTWAYPSRNLLT